MLEQKDNMGKGLQDRKIELLVQNEAIISCMQ
jgi:hypothetical protein